MKKHTKIVRKLLSLLPALAMVIGILAANSACACYYYQPETPGEMNTFRK